MERANRVTLLTFLLLFALGLSARQINVFLKCTELRSVYLLNLNLYGININRINSSMSSRMMFRNLKPVAKCYSPS